MHLTAAHRSKQLAPLLVFFTILLGGFSASPEASAQSLVIPTFSSKGKGAKPMAANAWKFLAQELKKQGAKIVSSKSYYKQARRMRIKRSRALGPKAIARVSKKMGIDGVLIGSVRRQGSRYRLNVTLRGSDGGVLFQKAYRMRTRQFPRDKAKAIADLIMQKTRPAVAEVPVEIAPPPETPPAAGTAPEGSGAQTQTGTDENFLPAWARGEDIDKDAPTTPPKEQSTSWAQTEQETPKPRGPRAQGSINDALLAVGASFHHRAGLNPRHEASLFPGLRIDGRMFLGSFLDMAGVRDIGFGGSFDMGLGLKYGYRDADTTWDASQMQWRAELLYRLAFDDVTTKPAILFKVGYGATSCSIDSEAIDVLDVSYMAPYAGLDLYLTLWEPMIRFFVSGSFLFLVSPGGDLNGSGMGFSVMAGVDVDLLDLIHIGVGYDMTQYMMEADGGGDYSDTYQGFFIRAGVSFN